MKIIVKGWVRSNQKKTSIIHALFIVSQKEIHLLKAKLLGNLMIEMKLKRKRHITVICVFSLVYHKFSSMPGGYNVANSLPR